ncbi:MAG: hypothetical protein FWF50_03170, partial [Defluviitaleaceae bacterium]|nr:hypothetical protein [Defluviitaleaceae bacterium]
YNIEGAKNNNQCDKVNTLLKKIEKFENLVDQLDEIARRPYGQKDSIIEKFSDYVQKISKYEKLKNEVIYSYFVLGLHIENKKDMLTYKQRIDEAEKIAFEAELRFEKFTKDVNLMVYTKEA